MKKIGIVTVLSILLVLVVSAFAMAGTVTYTRITDPASLPVYYANTWSTTKGYIDLTVDVPTGGTVNWIKLNSYTVFSSAGSYGNINVRIYNETGTAYSNLYLNQTNYDFAGVSAKQKFYIRFYTDYIQFPGNPVYLQRPSITISVTQ